jgi:hypothetical protein
MCNKKLHKEIKRGAQHMTLLKNLQGKKKTSTRHAPCTVNVTGEDLVKSTVPFDDSEAMLLFVSWRSAEVLRHIAMFSEVLSIDTAYGTNREKRPVLVFDGTYHNRNNFMMSQAFLPS